MEPGSTENACRIPLNEHDSKQLLSNYGIPVVTERIAEDAEGALRVSKELGYPVVLKGLGRRLMHKTERNLVCVNLTGEEAVLSAVKGIADRAGSDLEGFLVQPFITGTREFVAGLFRDPQFGPVVMFGLGGIYTEALSDVAFRIAPLAVSDAEDMMQEIRSRKLLDAFRGERPVDRNTLVQTLLGLSRLAVEDPTIAEIDINPLKITPDGRVLAVDAVVIREEGCPQQSFKPPIDPKRLGKLFYPHSIAFVGISANIGKWGHRLFSIAAARGYSGEIYLVNPRGGTIAGRPVFRNVSEVPGPIDLAVVTVPAAGVSALIPEFQQKGIHNVLLISSGFAETGEEGKALEKRLMEQAREAGILIIGPNTMGICNPHIQLYCTGSHVWPVAGATAVVAQSGNMGTQLLAFAENQGIGIRAFCGSGNEGMVTIEDFIDAFEVDDVTRTVMLYVESVKNGKRFMESARRVGRKKPIVLLKGGQTQAGMQAAASHTGAMASDTRIFNAMCKQAGIVKVERPMELLDLSAAFSSLPLPKGNRAAIMTLGGGWGVVTADLCAEYGLDVPRLPDSLIRRIDPILPPYWSKANPVDIVGENDLDIPLKIIEMLLQWDECDAVIHLGIKGRRILVNKMIQSIRIADPGIGEDFLQLMQQTMADFEKRYVERIIELMHTYEKPIFGVSLLTEPTDFTVYSSAGFSYKAVFYETPERAVNAFSKMVEYRRFLENTDQDKPTG
uniref:CoA-binding protein n=1 Tax=Desulfatirhabdium butyrativorans TaxID=340467 RepID=A0A7C4MMJ5_9BACT